MQPRDHLVLYVNGRRHEVRGGLAFRPLAEFLRSDCQLTGAKVVCAEGDCGSCTVLIGRPRQGQMEYQPVTSCIQYLAQLDATHVVTVEGLRYDGKLNPAQEALVAHHGSQCGFCTPGIVASLCGLFDRRPDPSRHDVTRALVGNLCRCTGYAAILDAAEHVDPAAMRRLETLYNDARMLDELDQRANEAVLLQDDQRKLFKPATLDQAVAFRAAEPGCTILSGATDLGVVWNKGRRELQSLLSIGDLAELRSLTIANEMLTAGAGTTIDELETATAHTLPDFSRMLARFGSPPIKSAATLGGNIANGSPIGDSLPALFVADAELELASSTGTRRVNINQFYTGYRQTVLRPDELIARVVIPLPARGDFFRVYKVSKRQDLDISTFAAAIWMRTTGDVIRAVRIAYAGVAPTIVRLPQTEAWLSERRLSEETMRQAGRIARSEIKPISDVRGSAEYRALLAENILIKFARDVMAEAVFAGEG